MTIIQWVPIQWVPTFFQMLQLCVCVCLCPIELTEQFALTGQFVLALVGLLRWENISLPRKKTPLKQEYTPLTHTHARTNTHTHKIVVK